MSDRKENISRSKPLIYVLNAKAYDTDTRVMQEVNSLLKHSFRAYVVSWDRDNKYRNSNRGNLKVKHLSLLTSRLFNKVLYILSALLLQVVIIFHGLFLMLKETYIIIHANDFNTLPAGAILKIFFPRSIKLVYDSHEHTPSVYEEWFSKRISKIVSFVERVFIRFADATITVSKPIKDFLQTIYKKNIFIIRNYPIQTVFPMESKAEARLKLGYSQDQFLAIFVGLMRLDIAIPEMIEAAKILKNSRNDNNIKIVFVGDGPLFDFVLEKRQEYELQDYIDIIGRVERELALIYLKASDISLIVMKGESFNSIIGTPWKLFESLSCNVPVIAKSGTTVAEIVNEYEAGVVLEELTGSKIAEVLQVLAESPKKKKFIIKEEFSWESQEDNLLEIYNNLLRKS
jgi:glycosyltransferase involved in cell wall biosynthesis